MRSIKLSLALSAAVLASACATNSSDDRLPSVEDRKALVKLAEPYLGCMMVESKKFADGGAPMQLSIDTAEAKCTYLLRRLDHYAAQRQLDGAYLGGAHRGAKKKGRILALEELTARPAQSK